jgi:hypothetical protein
VNLKIEGGPARPCLANSFRHGQSRRNLQPKLSANLKWIPETPLACELILFVLIFGMSRRMPQLVWRDALALSPQHFYHKNDQVLRDFTRVGRMKSWKFLPWSLPIKHLSISTAGQILVSKNRTVYAISVQWGAWVILSLHISDQPTQKNQQNQMLQNNAHWAGTKTQKILLARR